MMEYYEHKLDPVGVRPDWFDAPADASWQYLRGSIWFTAHQSPKEDFRFIGAIRIPASHWAVPALKAGKVPVRGDTDLNQRALEIIERIADQGVASVTDVRECRQIAAEMKPADPLVEAIQAVWHYAVDAYHMPVIRADELRAELAKHNLKIVEA